MTDELRNVGQIFDFFLEEGTNRGMACGHLSSEKSKIFPPVSGLFWFAK